MVAVNLPGEIITACALNEVDSGVSFGDCYGTFGKPYSVPPPNEWPIPITGPVTQK